MPKKRVSAKKPADKQKQAEKRAKREQRKIADAEAKRVAMRKKRIRQGAWILGGVIALGAIGFLIYDKASLEELPGVSKEAYEGRTHVAAGQQVPYQTPTPTSGTHSASSPRCGVVQQPMPPEFAVHALEHGGVVIWYAESLPTEEVSALEAIVSRFDDRVILSPNLQLTDPVVATSWTRLKAYDGADEEIAQFIEIYRGRGPENFSCRY